MHELPVTEGIFKVVMQAVEEHNPVKVNSVTIKMGEGVDYIPEIIEEYFQVFSEGTVADGAKIIADLVPTTIECKECGGIFKKDYSMRVCPSCGSPRLRPNIYGDLTVENISMEF